MKSGYLDIAEQQLPSVVLHPDLTAVILFSIFGLALSVAILPYLPSESLLWALSLH